MPTSNRHVLDPADWCGAPIAAVAAPAIVDASPSIAGHRIRSLPGAAQHGVG